MKELKVEDLLVENKLIAGFITEFLEYTDVAMNEDELILNRKLVKQYATNLQLTEGESDSLMKRQTAQGTYGNL